MIRLVAASAMILSMSPAIVAAQADAPTASVKPKSKLDPDAVRCIKTPIIGTLAQFTKTCMTNREWDRTRAEVQRMRSPNSCGSGQCGGS